MGEALGRSQGGFSTKLHLRAEGAGKPMAAVLTAGERHEQFALDALMDRQVRRPIANNGYDADYCARTYASRASAVVIPRTRKRKIRYDRRRYRDRRRVEPYAAA